MLLLQCPDEPGIVAAVGTFVAGAGGNIVEADQHSDPTAGLFLQRVEFDVDATRTDLAAAFAPIAERFDMRWDVLQELQRLNRTGNPLTSTVVLQHPGPGYWKVLSPSTRIRGRS